MTDTDTDTTIGDDQLTDVVTTADDIAAAGTTESGPDPADAFGDPPHDTLPIAARRALVTLLTSRFITRTRHPDAWRGLLDHEEEIRARLDELFLRLELDHDHEVAFKRQNGEDEAPVLLRREKPLSRDASLLLVLLRQEHAYTDALDEPVTVTRDHIAEFLARFQGDTAHDEVKVERRIRAAITALERLELLTAGADDPAVYTVSPAVVPLIGPAELTHLERTFLAAADTEASTAAEPTAEPEADTEERA